MAETKKNGKKVDKVDVEEDFRDYNIDQKLKLKRTDDPIYYIHEYGVDTDASHIYLMGDEMYVNEAGTEPGVEYVMANKFIKNLNILMRRKPDMPIIIHMKTCGGDFVEGMAIFDAIKTCPWPITIINYSHARSMSSIIFQAANKRVMLPHSHFMFHEGTFGIDGTQKQVYSAVDFNKKVGDPTMLNIYAEMMNKQGLMKGKGISRITKYLISEMMKKEDVYLTAQEAVDLGLADEIFYGNWPTLTEYTDEQLER